MKPPARRRTEPSRFMHKSNEEDQRVIVRSFCKGWTRKEQNDFLQGLKQQKNYELELDLAALQKKVPKRSLKEIEELINLLKSRVLRRVFLQVHKQIREEQRNKVPIEIWGELVDKLTGPHESIISAALSQVFVVAGTEPSSLIHSIPPDTTAFQSPPRSGPIPLRPKPSVQLLPTLLPTSPVLTFLPIQRINTLQTSTSNIDSNPSASTSLGGSTSNQPDSSSSSVEHTKKSQHDNASSSSAVQPSTPKTLTQESSKMPNPSHLESEPQPSTSGLSTATASASPLVVLPLSEASSAQSETSDQDSLHRPKVLKCNMNFEKIYKYLSDPDATLSSLSAMESAVLLDLLMSLPEELPLLDCKQIQHHLLQVFEQLSKPAQRPVPSPKTKSNNSQSNVGDSAELPQMDSETAGTSQSSGDTSGASVGIHLLNPLNIPVALLKRRSVETNE